MLNEKRTKVLISLALTNHYTEQQQQRTKWEAKNDYGHLLRSIWDSIFCYCNLKQECLLLYNTCKFAGLCNKTLEGFCIWVNAGCHRITDFKVYFFHFSHSNVLVTHVKMHYHKSQKYHPFVNHTSLI